MRFFLLSIFLIVRFFLSAQEGLSPLYYNTKLMQPQTDVIKKSAAVNEMYIYVYDTLSLPFLDDFSKDKFTPVAQPTDANVSSETFYHIMIGGLPDYSGRKYLDDTTYYINISQDGNGDLVKDSIPNPTITVDVYDLSVYPPTFETKSVWIDTTFVDSVFNTTSPDIYFVYNADFVQDSLIVYTVNPDANSVNYLWKDRFVYRSYHQGIDPPTIGVATFDATDDVGLPYDISNVSNQGLADEFTSKNLRLSPFIPADSIYLSFFYQYQGNGESPEVEDSLVLQFWSPLNKTWNSVWKATSINPNVFSQVLIPIKQNEYFFDGFQFRFRNYATLSGALDHWHLDYVYIDENRAFNDYNQPDVAHRYQPSSMLKDYESMPWEHYATNPSAFISDEFKVVHFNTNNVVESYEDNTVEVNFSGINKHTLVGPAIVPDFLPQSDITHTYNPSASGVTFDPTVDPYYAEFEIKSFYEHLGDFNPDNDTAIYTQRLINYYAYDDGSAERAYYVLDKNALIAQKFTSVVQDTLRALQIEFEPVAFNAQVVPFYVTVWAADGIDGVPGTTLHQNVGLNKPKYIGFQNDGFVDYLLDKELILPAGDFYIGIQQASETDVKINIGFDTNNDNSDKIYYNIDGDWFNTSLEGTLMMRAGFKTPADKFFLSEENVIEEEAKISQEVNVYPNPFTDKLCIDSDQRNFTYQLFTISGKLMLMGTTSKEISLSELPQGMYILRLIDKHQNIYNKKVIKQ